MSMNFRMVRFGPLDRPAVKSIAGANVQISVETIVAGYGLFAWFDVGGLTVL